MRGVLIQIVCAVLAVTAITVGKDPAAFIAAIMVIGALNKGKS